MRAFDPSSLPFPTIALEVREALARAFDHARRTGSPIDLEIGCGAGLHPIRYGQAHPERCLIAVEHTSERFAKFEGRLRRHPSITNIIAVHANAISVVAYFVPPESLDRCFILYPNPHPKRGHLNRRWYAMPFMSALIDRLKPCATLTLATNERDYAEQAIRALRETWGLRWLNEESHHWSGPPRTHFERKYLERGETCWNLEFSKG